MWFLLPRLAVLLSAVLCGLLPAQFAVPPAGAAQASPTGAWSGAFDDGLRFDALSSFTLVSVNLLVQPSSPPMRPVTINLRDASGSLLATTTQLVSPGLQRVALNFAVPMGLGHTLDLLGSAGPGFYVSTNVQDFSAFQAPGLVRILGAIQAPTNRYPFFYDLRVAGVASPGEWQVRRTAADLAIFGPETTTSFVTDAFAATGALTTSRARLRNFAASDFETWAGLSSDIPNALFDAGVSILPVRPRSAGALATAAGQIVNLDLTPSTFVFLNSAGFDLSFQPLMGFRRLQVDFPEPRIFSAQLIVVDPSALEGHVLSQGVQHEILRNPALEDFDSGNSGGLAASRPGYSIPRATPSSFYEWEVVGAQAAANLTTGPQSAFSGNAFAHVLTRRHLPGQAVVDTSVHEVALLSQRRLNFALSRIGPAVGTLSIWQIDDPSTPPTLLATYSGQDPAQSRGGLEWSQESLPFLPNGPVVQFRFDYLFFGGSGGDVAIDSVLIN